MKVSYPLYVFLLLILSWVSCDEGTLSQVQQRPVFVETVNIETESVGPLARNRIEFIFYNPNNIDNLEGNFSFSCNRMSFAKELWLEIDGEMKKGETFSRQTGEKIYERVTGKRLDPALLRTNGRGNFTLRVFPFKAHEKRKVVIELYSIHDFEDRIFNWRFHGGSGFIPSTRFNIKYNSTHPKGTRFFKTAQSHLDSTLIKSFPEENLFSFSKTKSIQLNFLYSVEQDTFIIFSDNNSFRWLIHPFQDIDRIEFPIGFPRHVVMEKLIAYTKQGSPIDLRNQFTRLSGLERNFVRYLISKHNADILFKKRNQLPHWQHNNGHMTYWSGRPILESISENEMRTHKQLKCSFLGFFLDYNDALQRGVAVQMGNGFLTPNTSKIVLEENDRIKEIRDEEIQRWQDSRIGIESNEADILDNLTLDEEQFDFEQNIENLPKEPAGDGDDDEPVVPFYALTEKPVEIYRVTPEYPEIAKKAGVEGTIVVKVLIDTSGLVEKVEVIKAHPLLNQAAIDAARQFEFEPAKQRGVPVKVWISIPFNFSLSQKEDLPDIEDIPNLPDSTNWFEYFDKTLIFAVINGQKTIIEKGAALKDATTMSNNSEEFFQLLYEKPELFKYFSFYHRALIIVDGRSFHIK